jgi:hypothetical protein
MPLTIVGSKVISSLFGLLLILVIANSGFAQQRPTDEERARRNQYEMYGFAGRFY